MKRLCLKTFRLINKDYKEGKKLMSEPEGIFNWNTVVCVSRDYCQRQTKVLMSEHVI